jgi:predicted dehydrogenase
LTPEETRSIGERKRHKRKLGVGVIGLGHNGIAFVQGYLNNPLCELKAICDISKGRLKDVTEEYNIRSAYNDYGILDRDDIDVISVHTSDHLHTEPVVKALEAGKHVFVEKPMAMTIDDLAKIVGAVKRSGTKLMAGHILRFNQHFRMVKELVDSGTLGRIFYMEGDYVHDLRYQADPARYSEELGCNWYLEREIPMVGGGIHPFDLLRWFVGCNAIEVKSYGNHVAFPAMKSDDCMAAIFKFENGCLAKVAATYGCVSPYAFCNHVSVYGTKGTVNRDKLCLEGFGERWADLPPLSGEGHPYDPEIDSFLRCILEGTEPPVDVVDAANSTSAVITAAEATNADKGVKIPLFSW